jgi:autotransporter adhesin
LTNNAQARRPLTNVTQLAFIREKMKTRVTIIAAAAALACNLSEAQVMGTTTNSFTSVGVSANAQLNGTSVGVLANAGPQAVAVGGSANANAPGAVAVGGCINIICVDASTGAIVNQALPVGTSSTAVGAGSMTPADGATAVGANSNASNVNSVALGVGSRTTRDNSVEVGGRQITGVTAGSSGTDAVNVDQLNGGLSSTLNQAKAYADTKASDGVSQAVNQARAYTDAKAGDALTSSKGYADARAAETLKDSSAYSDAKAAETLSGANVYTDNKTKYFSAKSDGFASQTNGQDSVAVGPGTVANGNGSIAGGLNATANADNTVVFGSSATASADSAAAFGHGSQAFAVNSTAVGPGATAVNANDVAIGYGSNTSAVVATAGTAINGTNYGFAAPSPTSTVSVGTQGAERTITNVAAGQLSGRSTDAVNGSQLSATNTALDVLGRATNHLGAASANNLGGGSTYDPATGTVTAPTYSINGMSYDNVGGAFGAVGSTVSATNPKNLAPATASGGNSVAVGPGSIADRDDSISFGSAGAERQLVNVAAGRLSPGSTDAVNGSQLHETNGSIHALGDNMSELGASTARSLGGGSAYDPSTGAVSAPSFTMNGKTYENVAGAFSALGTSVAASNPRNLPPASAKGANSVAIGPGSKADRENTLSIGSAGAERQLVNVAAGRLTPDSTDAVNGSQLHRTNTALTALGTSVRNQGASAADNFGAGSTYDPNTGAISSPNYTLNNVSYTSVGSALGALGAAVAANNSEKLPPAAALGRNSAALGPGSVADRDNTVSIGTPGAERQLANVAPGTAPTDATNVGQVASMVEKNSRGDRSYTDDRVNALDARNQKQMAGVGAMAMAASALVPNARAEGKTSLSAAVGTYGGESAIAAGVNYYISNQLLVNAKLALATAGPAKAGASVGLTWGF